MNEEKERYYSVIDCNGNFELRDYECGKTIHSLFELDDLLNQQDKQIKALNTKLVEKMELSAERRQIIEDLTIENKQQFKRIRESEEEIERIKEINLYNKDLAQNSIRDALVLIQENQQLKQSQKQLVIDELEKIKEFCETFKYRDNDYDFVIVKAKPGIRCVPGLYKQIDYQIKQLEVEL